MRAHIARRDRREQSLAVGRRDLVDRLDRMTVGIGGSDELTAQLERADEVRRRIWNTATLSSGSARRSLDRLEAEVRDVSSDILRALAHTRADAGGRATVVGFARLARPAPAHLRRRAV